MGRPQPTRGTQQQLRDLDHGRTAGLRRLGLAARRHLLAAPKRQREQRLHDTAKHIHVRGRPGRQRHHLPRPHRPGVTRHALQHNAAQPLRQRPDHLPGCIKVCAK